MVNRIIRYSIFTGFILLLLSKGVALAQTTAFTYQGKLDDRIGVLLINTIKEQQAQIESLQKDNLEMKARLAALEQLMQRQLDQQIKNINKEKYHEKKKY